MSRAGLVTNCAFLNKLTSIKTSINNKLISIKTLIDSKLDNMNQRMQYCTYIIYFQKRNLNILLTFFRRNALCYKN